MAEHRPLILDGGRTKQLPTGDTIAGAGGGASPTELVRFSTIFEVATRYQISSVGSMSAGILSGGGMFLDTGTTSSSWYRGGLEGYDAVLNASQFSWHGQLLSFANDWEVCIGVGYMIVTGSVIGYTQKQYGFKIVNVSGTYTLYATCGSGAAETSTSLGTIANFAVPRLSAAYDGTSVTYYVDGTLVATHTTNVPTFTGALQYTHLQLGLTNKATTGRVRIVNRHYELIYER